MNSEAQFREKYGHGPKEDVASKKVMMRMTLVSVVRRGREQVIGGDVREAALSIPMPTSCGTQRLRTVSYIHDHGQEFTSLNATIRKGTLPVKKISVRGFRKRQSMVFAMGIGRRLKGSRNRRMKIEDGPKIHKG